MGTPVMNRPQSGTADASQILIVAREGDRTLGYVAIDSLVGGRAHGGIRLRQDVTADEVRLLAQTMTGKYRFLGLPFGGAKAGVVGDPDAPREERRRRLERFAYSVRPLLEHGIFVPAADMGTDIEDIHEMLRRVGVHVERRRLPRVDSGIFTAHSVLAAARELVRHRGGDLGEMCVGIEGFGKVGSALARMLADLEVKVVAVSTSAGGCYDAAGLDVSRLLELSNAHGRDFVDHVEGCEKTSAETFWRLPVDLMIPCAMTHTITSDRLPALQAKLICPAANNPWPESLESELDAMGIVYLPDFVCNAGGILGTTMVYAGLPIEEIGDFLRRYFSESVRWVLQRAKVEGITVRQSARQLAEKRSDTGPRGTLARLATNSAKMGLRLHRRGLAPLPLVRPLARRYFNGLIKKGLG